MKRLLIALVPVMVICVTSAFSNPVEMVIDCDDKGKIKDEIVSAYMGLKATSLIALRSVNDYQVIFDQETQGILASMLMNVYTLRKPIFRTTFDLIPNNATMLVKAKVEIIQNPDTYNALIVMGKNKDVDPLLLSVLDFIRWRLKGRIKVSMAEYQELLNSKPQIGIVVDNRAKVLQVLPKSIAAKAGIKKGDIIVEIDDEKVRDDVKIVLFEKREVGHTLKLRLQRKGKKWNVKLQL